MLFASLRRSGGSALSEGSGNPHGRTHRERPGSSPQLPSAPRPSSVCQPSMSSAPPPAHRPGAAAPRRRPSASARALPGEVALGLGEGFRRRTPRGSTPLGNGPGGHVHTDSDQALAAPLPVLRVGPTSTPGRPMPPAGRPVAPVACRAARSGPRGLDGARRLTIGSFRCCNRDAMPAVEPMIPEWRYRVNFSGRPAPRRGPGSHMCARWGGRQKLQSGGPAPIRAFRRPRRWPRSGSRVRGRPRGPRSRWRRPR